MFDEELFRQNLRVRLPWPCGPNLIEYYVQLGKRRGISTTTADAFRAWEAWMLDIGGKPEATLSPLDWPQNDHERVAAAIRESSRYANTPEAPAGG
jgi:hypothetical protein